MTEISKELEVEIEKFIIANPTWGNRRLSRKFGISKGQAQKRVVKHRKPRSIAKMKKTGLRGCIDAATFIEEHDVPKQIRDALPLLEGRVISDSNFRASLGIAGQSWARARDLEEFEGYQKKVKGKLYWATPETFEELQRKMDIL